jgi:hypothetical protein
MDLKAMLDRFNFREIIMVLRYSKEIFHVIRDGDASPKPAAPPAMALDLPSFAVCHRSGALGANHAPNFSYPAIF